MNMESNKLLAALLVAGIIAYLAGFIGHMLVKPEKLAENAYKIEGVEAAAVAGADAPTEAEPIDGLMAGADVTAGEKIGKVCASCHTFKGGEPHKIGPNLASIIGKSRAHAEGYAYSDAMKNAGGKWNGETMNQFLWNPKKAIPGTKMTFAGLKKPEDRAALIKWLSTQK